MGKKTSIDDMGNVIKKSLEEYVELTAAEVKKVVTEVSESTKNQIIDKAPVRTGKYKKSWKNTKVEESASSLVMSVHSEGRYRLTHLLENGHAKRGGGRVKAYVHIAPAETNAEKELLSAIERRISK